MGELGWVTPHATALLLHNLKLVSACLSAPRFPEQG